MDGFLMDPVVTSTESSRLNELEAIIADLNQPHGELPVEAIEAARQHRDAIIPYLIRLIEDATRECRIEGDVEANGHFYATFLLGEFKASEAWSAVVEAISLPDDLPFEMYGDMITEDMGYILASIVGDRRRGLDDLIANPQINPYVRWQAVDAMLYQIRDGIETRESVLERLTDHLRWAIESRDAVAEGIVVRLAELGVKAALPLIEKAFEKGLDNNVVSRACVQELIDRGEEGFQETMANLCPPHDLIAYLRTWDSLTGADDYEPSSFDGNPTISFEPDLGGDFPDLGDDFFMTDDQATIRNAGTKIGRNDTCPCGSGVKYKKCCGKN